MKLYDFLSYHKPFDKRELIEIYDISNLDKPIEILKPSQSSKYNNCNIERFYVKNNRICVEIYKG